MRSSPDAVSLQLTSSEGGPDLPATYLAGQTGGRVYQRPQRHGISFGGRSHSLALLPAAAVPAEARRFDSRGLRNPEPARQFQCESAIFRIGRLARSLYSPPPV